MNIIKLILKYKPLILGFILILLSFSFVFAQTISLSGQWEGKIYQKQGKLSNEYKVQMYFHDKPSGIIGRSYVYYEDIFCEMKLVGEKIDGTTMVFREIEIIKDKKYNGMEWCMKTGTLILKQTSDGLKLSGSWNGKTSFSDCEPGILVLQKIIPKA